MPITINGLPLTKVVREDWNREQKKHRGPSSKQPKSGIRGGPSILEPHQQKAEENEQRFFKDSEPSHIIQSWIQDEQKRW